MTNTPVTGRTIHIYLPVEGPGALFSMVDGHAAQGDGEVCGTAIETPMRATVRLTVRKDLQVPEPQFLTQHESRKPHPSQGGDELAFLVWGVEGMG